MNKKLFVFVLFLCLGCFKSFITIFCMENFFFDISITNQEGLCKEKVQIYEEYCRIIKTNPNFIIYEYSSKFFKEFLLNDQNDKVVTYLYSILLKNNNTPEIKISNLSKFFQNYDKEVMSKCFDNYLGFIGAFETDSTEKQEKYEEKQKREVFKIFNQQKEEQKKHRKESGMSDTSKSTVESEEDTPSLLARRKLKIQSLNLFNQ